METVILLARLSRHLMCFSRNYNSVDVSTHLRSMSDTGYMGLDHIREVHPWGMICLLLGFASHAEAGEKSAAFSKHLCRLAWSQGAVGTTNTESKVRGCSVLSTLLPLPCLPACGLWVQPWGFGSRIRCGSSHPGLVFHASGETSMSMPWKTLIFVETSHCILLKYLYCTVLFHHSYINIEV